MKRRENAYFTVEAAMVLPIVLLVIVLLIYLLFFQYNRCLMEQDIGALALKGCTIQESSKEALMETLEYYAEEIDREKYVIWSMDNVELKLEAGSIRASQRGELQFPFSGLMRDVGRHWGIDATYENQRINPVDFIRTYRKMTGGK